jgi:predicted HTH domain antitoxin
MRTVELDDEIASLLEQEKPLEQAARESIVMDLYRREKISIGKACELLGLARMDFVRRAGELGVPVDLTTSEEWEKDKAALDAWRQRS